MFNPPAVALSHPAAAAFGPPAVALAHPAAAVFSPPAVALAQPAAAVFNPSAVVQAQPDRTAADFHNWGPGCQLSKLVIASDHLEAGNAVSCPSEGGVHRVARGPVLPQQHVVANTVHLEQLRN